ncbi:hypothetical protein PSPO01_15633 [Paraphaeosphaeria sporulosa]
MPRGRPRKYQNQDEAAEAARRLRQQRYQRQRQAQAPPEFIQYEPVPISIPTNTAPDLGLRISNDIPIPRDTLTEPDELPGAEDTCRPASPLASLGVDDVEAAAVINQRRASDREQTSERVDNEQRILQQMRDIDARAASILLEIQAGTAQVHTSTGAGALHTGEIEGPEEVQHSSHTGTAHQSRDLAGSKLQPLRTALIAEKLAAAVRLDSYGRRNKPLIDL